MTVAAARGRAAVLVLLLGALAVSWIAASADGAQGTDAERARAQGEIDALGLGHLRIAQLERQLEEASRGPRRNQIAEDLALAYLQEVTRGGEVTPAFRERADRLLADFDPAVEDSLLVRLAQREYEDAARVAERARSDGAAAAELAAASDLLRHAERCSGQALARLVARRPGIAKVTAGASGQERLRLERGLATLDELLLEARFRHAWSGYWLLWLAEQGAGSGERGEAQGRLQSIDELVRRFGAVLEIESGLPRPAEASIDLRGLPYYASAIEGMALVQALAGRDAHSATMALAWIDLLRDPATAAASRAAVPDLELVVAADARDWRQVSRLLDAGERSGTATVVAAVAALRAAAEGEGDGVQPSPGQVALGAMFGLARDMEYRRLAGLRAAVDGSGLRQSEATLLLDAAESLVAAEGGMGEARAAAARRAVDPLRKLLASDVVTANADVTRSIRGSLGWALLEAGSAAEAAAILEKAAEGEGKHAERVLWLAIMARERAAGAGGASDPALERLRAEYLRRFSASGRQTELLVRESASRQPADPAMVPALRKVPPSDVAWGAAQGELSRIHYAGFRGARGEARAAQAEALLAVPLPMAEPATAAIVLRRQLEAAVDEDVRAFAAADALLRLARERLGAEVSDPSVRAELACRAVERAALGGDLASACSSLGTMDPGGPSSPWREVAGRALLRAVQRQAAAGGSLDQAQWECAARVAQAELAALASGDRDTLLGLCDVVLMTEDRTTAAQALAALTALPAVDSGSPSILEMRGRLLELLADEAGAIEAYRQAALASVQGQAGWYRAKARLAAILERVDPSAARALLAQHKALDPSWGPGEDGAALQAIAERLGVGSSP